MDFAARILRTAPVTSGSQSVAVRGRAAARRPVARTSTRLACRWPAPGSRPCQSTAVDASVTATATFAINTYQLHYTAVSNGTISGNASQTVVYNGSGTAVTAVPAAHETLETDEHGDSVFLGYVIDIAGFRIYHSGDCVPYEGQSQLLREHSVDLALLPINGRDSHRLDERDRLRRRRPGDR